MKSKIDLSLILACYNDAKYLYKNFIELVNTLNLLKINYEIVFVDDKSKDNTVKIMKQIQNKFKGRCDLKFIFHPKNTGRGKAVRDGFTLAKGRIIGFLDVDLEVHPHYILSMIKTVNEGYDIATIYRIYKLKLSFSVLLRHIITHSYRYISRFILNHNLNDTETGFKFFNKESIQPVLKRCQYNGWFWDTEIMILSLIKNLKIKEIPGLFIRMKGKKSKTKIFKDTLDYIINLWRFKKEIKNAKLKMKNQFVSN